MQYMDVGVDRGQNSANAAYIVLGHLLISASGTEVALTVVESRDKASPADSSGLSSV